jgi:hypothetical protein
VCLGLTACFLFTHFHQEKSLSKKIKKMPLEDRLALEAFFRILILQEGGAYVLFGDKPMAFTGYFYSCEPNFSSKQRYRYYSENQTLSEGWKIWKKYQNTFCSKHFVLECKPLDHNRSEICLIHKPHFKDIAQKHWSFFQSILGEKATPITLITQYESSDAALFHLLKQHHALLGILLGFGTKNAWLFHEHLDEMNEDPNRMQIIPFKHVSERSVAHSLEGIFQENNYRQPYKFLWLPFFLADRKTHETQVLRRKYLKQRQEIHRHYSHGDFLEVTLRKFCLN